MDINEYLLKKAEKEVKPVYAQAFFNVSLKEISYFLIFDYYDKYRYYEKVILNEKLYEKEMEKLFLNMQYFLNKEKIKVNNKKCKPKVKMVDLDFRGNFEKPSIIYLIKFNVEIKKGLNIYENMYETEFVSYDYKAYWNFPKNCKILNVEMKEENEIINQRLLIIYGKKGTISSGYEKITFTYE